MFKNIVFALFFLSIFLICLNLIGLTTNLRNEGVYQEKQSLRYGIDLSEEDFHKEYSKIFNTDISDSMKVARLTKTVNRAMLHYWYKEKGEAYNIKIPISENYILYTLGVIYPERFGMYEFVNWRKGIERGVGLCSQQAIVETEILNENGIEASVVGLDGHVVVTAKIENDRWIMADPDYGVIIPFDLKEIESNTNIIKPYYYSGFESYYVNYESLGSKMEFDKNIGLLIEKIRQFYGPEGNVINNDYFSHSHNNAKIEKLAYLWIWLIPLILSLPFVLIKIINLIEN